MGLVNYESGPGFSELGSDPDSALFTGRLCKRLWIPSGIVTINQEKWPKFQTKLNRLIDCAIKNTENLVRIMFLHRLIAPVVAEVAAVAEAAGETAPRAGMM